MEFLKECRVCGGDDLKRLSFNDIECRGCGYQEPEESWNCDRAKSLARIKADVLREFASEIDSLYDVPEHYSARSVQKDLMDIAEMGLRLEDEGK